MPPIKRYRLKCDHLTGLHCVYDDYSLETFTHNSIGSYPNHNRAVVAATRANDEYQDRLDYPGDYS